MMYSSIEALKAVAAAIAFFFLGVDGSNPLALVALFYCGMCIGRVGAAKKLLWEAMLYVGSWDLQQFKTHQAAVTKYHKEKNGE